ncbi:MAG: sigma-70 family RNA polymerase sigma factor [Candidatus Latescibacterota bacterium]|jgi:RNA polymerase sigma factor (sigma-70 family)|tara:strand:+ start:586 stop:954 length:369 start_codon:yes stop_codon:yes gene_type:complete
MFNPDFWEVRIDPEDLEQFSNEAGIWFNQMEQERTPHPAPLQALLNPVMNIIDNGLTEKQRQVLLLYYMHQKTQEEVAEIMGISRRVVSQHLFGICRDGKRVGGAITKIRKLCRRQGLAPSN